MLKKLNEIFSAKEKIQIFILLIMLIIRAGVELLGIFMILPVIRICMNTNVIHTNKYLSFCYDNLHFTSEYSFMVWFLLMFILVYILKNLYLSFVSYIRNKIIFSQQLKICNKFMKYYLYQNYEFYLTTNSAEIIRNIVQNATQFSRYLLSLLTIVIEYLLVILITIFLIYISTKLAIVSIITIVISLGIYFKFFDKMLGRMGTEYQNKHVDIIKSLRECYDAMKEIKIYKNESFFFNNFEDAMKSQTEALYTNSLFSELPPFIIETLCVTVILSFLAYAISSNNINLNDLIPQLALIAMAVFRLLPAMNRINNSYATMTFFKSSINTIHSELALLEKDKKNNNDITKIKKSIFDITLSNVEYTYPNCKEPVLKNINIKIPAGTFVGITGKSGAGKSTLADIIQGILIPQKGQVYYGEHDIHKENYDWSHSIAYVPQNIYILDDTIENNIIFGNTIRDKERIKAVIYKSQLKEFINSLPDKEQTIVGERGIKLSGGQKQRIALARVLYYNPEIIVMDEATSALDYETEQAIIDTINELKKQRTLIVITHRLNTIKNCDMRIHIQDNTIKEIENLNN